MSRDISAAGFTDVGVNRGDKLVVGSDDNLFHAKGVANLAAAASLERGCLMGRVLGKIQEVGKAGNGATVEIGAVTGARLVRQGRYTLRCTTAGAPAAARYQLLSPEGVVVASTLRHNVAHNGSHLGFTLTQTGDDAVVGDEWYLDIGAVKWARSVSGAVGGPAVPAGILAETATNNGGAAADIQVLVYIQGVFDGNEVFRATGGGTGHTLDSVRPGLADVGCVLEPSIVHGDSPVDNSAIV